MKCPHQCPWNLWICYLTQQKGLLDVFKIKNVEMQDYPGLSQRAKVNHMTHSKWRGFPFDGQREIWPQKKERCSNVDFENGGRETQVVECGENSRNQTRKWISSGKELSLPTFCFYLVIPLLDFWPKNCQMISLYCFKPIKFVAIWYSSNRKLKQDSFWGLFWHIGKSWYVSPV